MNRLNSTSQTYTSLAWAPTAETILQLSAVDANATVDVETQLDATAPWIVVATLHATSRRIERVAKLPTLRLVLNNNQSGGAANVWDTE